MPVTIEIQIEKITDPEISSTFGQGMEPTPSEIEKAMDVMLDAIREKLPFIKHGDVCATFLTCPVCNDDVAVFGGHEDGMQAWCDACGCTFTDTHYTDEDGNEHKIKKEKS